MGPAAQGSALSETGCGGAALACHDPSCSIASARRKATDFADETVLQSGLGRYFSNLVYSLECLNALASLSRAARPTTLPKSWSRCFRRRPPSNSSRYLKLSCSICGSETQPVAAKRCCACALTKSFRALSTRARSIAQSQGLRRNTKASVHGWWYCALR